MTMRGIRRRTNGRGGSQINKRRRRRVTTRKTRRRRLQDGAGLLSLALPILSQVGKVIGLSAAGAGAGYGVKKLLQEISK